MLALKGSNWEESMGIKRFLIVFLCIVIVCMLTVFWFERDIIFQEGNPVPIAFGIAKPSFTGDDLIKVTSTSEKYLVRSKDGNEAFISYMEKEGWRFTDQMGA